MSLSRSVQELGISVLARFARTNPKFSKPSSIFVLRNNDIGDLLIVTPLFEALKRGFPSAKIIAGVGKWNFPVLANNHYVDEIIEVNAPWHNKFVCKVPYNSVRGLLHSLRYIYSSAEALKVKQLRADVGIDVLGSHPGSLLMMRAGIPWRMGIQGYAGGHSACQQRVIFDEETHVGRAALQFAKLLGITEIPENRPQIFLSQTEKDQAMAAWNASGPLDKNKTRLLVAPGGGFAEKCWPKENYHELIARLAKRNDVQILIVGSQSEYELGEYVRNGSSAVANLCGKTSLRQTFALAWASDAIICNTSMISHVAAAFHKPTLVLLGSCYDSARGYKKLWGYDALDLHLGKESDHNKIYSSEEVMPALRSHFNLA
jgi:ADP-heptose:LPS heptosyltransferase